MDEGLVTPTAVPKVPKVSFILLAGTVEASPWTSHKGKVDGLDIGVGGTTGIAGGIVGIAGGTGGIAGWDDDIGGGTTGLMGGGTYWSIIGTS